MTAQTRPILLIEDDATTRQLYATILQNAGYRVETAVDGESGLKKAQGGGWALILLDVMLPKLDGLDVITALKKNPPAQANGPIMLMTNLAGDAIIQQGLTLGAHACITKADTTPQQLVAFVKKNLS